MVATPSRRCSRRRVRRLGGRFGPRFGWPSLSLGVAVVVAGCSSPDPYAVAMEQPAVDARQEARQRVEGALARVSAALPLRAQAFEDSCAVGQDNFMVREDFRVRCGLGRVDVRALRADDARGPGRDQDGRQRLLWARAGTAR